ncbi:MAG: HAD family hydrolase [Thermodesulfobacteriota bacterium]|nr:HAD family hydrolase [Thermodesulfobacteriota bacterium]
MKGIFFDVHDTLINKGGDAALKNALKSVTEYLINKGYPITFEQYVESWKKNILKHRQDIYELNEVNFDDWYRGVLEGLKITDYTDSMIIELNAAWMEGFKGRTTVLKNVRETLEKLQGKYILGIVSNSLAENTNIDLQITDLARYFKVFCISSRVGKRKPHPAIFKKALEDSGLKPGEVIFVGDNLYEDIYGASQAGFRTMLLGKKEIENKDNSKNKMLKELKIEVSPDIIIEDFSEILTVLKNLEKERE